MIEVFRVPFMQQALLAGSIVAALCSFLAVHVVLKRIVFVGIALAQMSSAGVALAMLVGWSPMVCSFAFMLVGVAMLSMRWSESRIPRESVIGLSYAAAAALAILLLYKSAQGEAQMLNLFRGNLLAASPRDSLILAGVLVVVGALHFAFRKEFLFSSYDPETARTLGVRARLWELLFYLSLGIVIAVGIRVAGVLLIFAFLTVPGMTGLLLCRRLRPAVIVAVAAGLIPMVVGLYLSFVLDQSPEAAIVFLSFAFLCVSAMVSRLARLRAA